MRFVLPSFLTHYCAQIESLLHRGGTRIRRRILLVTSPLVSSRLGTLIGILHDSSFNIRVQDTIYIRCGSNHLVPQCRLMRDVYVRGIHPPSRGEKRGAFINFPRNRKTNNTTFIIRGAPRVHIRIYIYAAEYSLAKLLARGTKSALRSQNNRGLYRSLHDNFIRMRTHGLCNSRRK